MYTMLRYRLGDKNAESALLANFVVCYLMCAVGKKKTFFDFEPTVFQTFLKIYYTCFPLQVRINVAVYLTPSY